MGVFPHDLHYIVSSVKWDIDLHNTKHDAKFFKWAIDGFRKLNMANLLDTYKTVKLTLDSDNSVFVPDDYQDYVKIGVCVGGYIVNFDANENICLKRDSPCSCDTISQSLCASSEGTGDEWMYLPYFQNGQFVSGLFGRGEGYYHGGYKYDHERRKFQFDVSVGEILLEYQSNGNIGANGNAYIPEYSVEALRQYVHWQRCIFSTIREERQMIPIHRRAFKNAATSVLRKVAGMTPAEILDIVRSSFHMLPKR